MYSHYLLAASGINPGSTRKDLNSLNTYKSTVGSFQQPTDWDPDSSKYVNQLQQQSTLKMIDDGLKRAQRDFDAYLEEHVDINWEEQRRKIYEHFGLTAKGGSNHDDTVNYPNLGGSGSFGRPSQRGRRSTATRPGHATPNRSVFGNSGMQKSVIGTPGVGSGSATLFADVADKIGPGPGVHDDRFLREKQSKFAEKVQGLNEARLQERAYPVLHEFADVEGQPGGEVSLALLSNVQVKLTNGFAVSQSAYRCLQGVDRDSQGRLEHEELQRSRRCEGTPIRRRLFR